MKDCLAELKSIAKAYEQRALAAWGEHKESAFYVGVSIGLVKTFVGITGFRAKASKLAEAIADLDSKVADVPQSDAEWDAIEVAYKLCQRLIKELPFGNLPDGVSEFLEATVAGGAALSGLTKEVKDWIKQNDLEKSFVIRAASSISHSDRLL